jgi:hypothetical protein
MPNVGILDYHQAASEDPTTYVDREIAVLLVMRLAAEQISRKKIRIFPPTSAFPTFKSSQALPGSSVRYIPEHMPSGEIANCHFQLPQSDGWKREHLQARRYSDEMAYLMRRSLRKAVTA